MRAKKILTLREQRPATEVFADGAVILRETDLYRVILWSNRHRRTDDGEAERRVVLWLTMTRTGFHALRDDAVMLTG